jgi:hypothetical protein
VFLIEYVRGRDKTILRLFLLRKAVDRLIASCPHDLFVSVIDLLVEVLLIFMLLVLGVE